MKDSPQLVSLLLRLIKEIIVIKRYYINIDGYHPFVLKVQTVKNLLTALIFSLVTTVWAGDLEDGFTAYGKGDYKAAFSFHKKAAEQGDAIAQTMLGAYYNEGTVVRQDYVEAVRWYKLAAAQGQSGAQNNLGVMYRNGEGVLQDYAEAVRWYKLAAAQGHSNAQFNLGVRYNNGEGVLQDYLKAHMWWNLAATSGDKDAHEGRDSVAKKMTPQQIAKAQAMAKKCLASQYKGCD